MEVKQLLDTLTADGIKLRDLATRCINDGNLEPLEDVIDIAPNDTVDSIMAKYAALVAQYLLEIAEQRGRNAKKLQDDALAIRIAAQEISQNGLDLSGTEASIAD
ncbi:MAG: hypothetical protein WAX89_04810 [Alphaproteobacteria bacterium]